MFRTVGPGHNLLDYSFNATAYRHRQKTNIMAEINYNEVIDGELVKFEVKGKTIEGLLQSYRAQRDTGKGPGHVYEIKTTEGVAAFFAPSLLHKKLSSIAIGSIVKIVFTDITKTANGNTLKHFDVKHAPATEANLKMLGLDVLKTVADDEAAAEKSFNGEE